MNNSTVQAPEQGGPSTLRAAIGDPPPGADKASYVGSGRDDGPPTDRQIAEWLRLFVEDGHFFEIRAPKWRMRGRQSLKTVSLHFKADELAEAAREALKLSGRAPAVYFTLNPIKRRLQPDKAASTADIVARRWLLIDCDPTRPADTSATDVEKAAALELAGKARKFLDGRGWPAPIAADSGNGAHLLYRIDLPAEDGGTVRAVLNALADRFDTDACKIDRKVFDPPRICKLYGTETRKGHNVDYRPHRFSRVLEVPAEVKPVPTELLEALAREAPAVEKALPPAAAPPAAGRRPRASTSVGSKRPDAVTRASKYLATCAPAVSGQGGHGQTLFVAKTTGCGFGLSPDQTFQMLWADYNPRCEPPWTERELRHKVDEAYKIESRRGWMLDDSPNGNGAGNGRVAPPSPPPPAELQTAGDSIMPNEAPDDPHRLARIVLAGFCHPDGPTLAYFRESFHVWDGACWKADPGFVPVILVNEVKAELDRKNVQAIEAWEKAREDDALRSGPGRPSLRPVARKVTRVLVSNVVQALAAMTSVDRAEEPPFWITPRPDDPDPLSFMPARNELVMLGPKSVVSMEHTPRYFSTYALPYDYQPSAAAPHEWLGFLQSQWGNDPDSIRELQKWFGLILTLEIKYQKMLLLIGPPRSGRSTIKDVMTKLIGRRNVAATSAVSLSDNFGLEPMVGKSLAIMGDARTGDTHDAAVLLDRVLRITGCDPVEVNRKGKTILYDVLMRTRFVVVSNEMPNFRDNSRAIVTRYLPLLMTESFEGREDYGLAERLNAELPSILNWAIAGRVMLHQDGRFVPPPSAAGLLDDARSLASPVAEFVAEECDLNPKASSSKRELWERWKAWAERSGHKPGTMQIFSRNLRAAANYKITDSRPRGTGDDRTRHWVGIDLKFTSPAGATPNASAPF